MLILKIHTLCLIFIMHLIFNQIEMIQVNKQFSYCKQAHPLQIANLDHSCAVAICAKIRFRLTTVGGGGQFFVMPFFSKKPLRKICQNFFKKKPVLMKLENTVIKRHPFQLAIRKQMLFTFKIHIFCVCIKFAVVFSPIVSAYSVKIDNQAGFKKEAGGIFLEYK